MRILRFLLFFLALTLLVRVDADSGESALRQAERAMLRNDYVAAKTLFKQLLDREKWSPDFFANLTVRLATAEQQLGNLEEAKRLLETLDMSHLRSNRRLEGTVLLARLQHRLNDTEGALMLLCNLDRTISRKKWRREDRAFFTGLLMCITDRYQLLLREAEQCLEGGLYREASSLYQQVLNGIMEGQVPLGASRSSMVANLRLRLAETAYKEGRYQETIQWLLPLQSERYEIDPTAESYQPLFLLGLAQVNSDQYQLALANFLTYLNLCSPQAPKRPEVLWNAGLCLFRLGELDKAVEMFSSLTSEQGSIGHLANIYLARIDLKAGNLGAARARLSLLKHDSEVSYLLGEVALREKAYEAAVQHFERASAKHSQWETSAILGLAESRLRLKNYKEAESTFKQLPEEKRAVLGLARTYLAQGARAQAEALLSHMNSGEALLLMAEAKNTFSEREEIYKQICSTAYLDTPAYGLGWLARGMDQFQNDKEEAAETLQVAFEVLQQTRPKEAALALKTRAQALYNHQKHEQARSALEELIKSPTFAHLQEQDEVYYLLGLSGAPEYFNHVSPTSSYAPLALHALATLNYQGGELASAETLFVRLAENHPNSSLASDAYFWASSAREAQGYDAKAYRRLVFERYPDSQYAGESYFLLYTFSEYMQGNQLAHLKRMPELFPNSPFTMVAHYLLGLHTKENAHFSEVSALFDRCDIAEEKQEYFVTIHHRALLELARASNKAAVERILSEDPEPKILAEAEFLLAQILLDEGGDAETLFNQIIAKGGGYYRARAWQEKGRLLIQRKEYQEALRSLTQVEDALITTDQRLEVKILQSYCHRELGDFNTAMLLLSQVINNEAASSRRIEAMFLRATIYELQGRYELAFKQLEATTKKGGEWAQHAETKLKEEYGYF